MLGAARELFETLGYEGTTVRQIAERAGVSVGSVFTNFASKAEVLSEVMQARLDGLYAELDRVAPRLRGSTADRLRSVFAIYFAFETGHVRLFLGHIAAAYDWTPGSAAHPYGTNPRLKGVIHDCLAKGVQAGDVDPSIDLDAVVELLVAAYAWTFRLAGWNGADADTLTAVMDRQIGLIAEGFERR